MFKQSSIIKETFSNLNNGKNTLNTIFKNDTLYYNQRRTKIDKLIDNHSVNNNYTNNNVNMVMGKSYNNIVEDYNKNTGTYPKWNFQESNNKYPSDLAEEYGQFKANKTKNANK